MMDKEKRLFLLDRHISNLLVDLETKPLLHEIFFTKIKLCKEVRYEHTPRHYLRIVKSGAQYTQTVTYHKSSKKEFLKAKKHQKGELIRKKRHRVQLEGCTLTIDAYRKGLKGLFMLEIAQECDDKVTSLLHNKLFSRHIREDVTSDPRYEEKYLALFGNPSRFPYNIYTIFKEIEHRRLKRVEEVIFNEMKSADAVRIMLYQKEHAIATIAKQATQKRTLTQEEIESYTRETEEMLQLFDIFALLFDPLLLQRITSHLRTLKNIATTYHDLIFIRKSLDKLKKQIRPGYMQKLQENLEAKITAEEEKIIRYFASREFKIIMSQLVLFLKEKNRSYNSYEAQLPLGYTLKLEQKKLLGDLHELIDLLDGCNDETSYRRIENAVGKLHTFLRLFQPLDIVTVKPEIQSGIRKVRKCLAKHSRHNKMLLILKMFGSEAALRKEKKTHKMLLNKEMKISAKEKSFAHRLYRRLHQLGKKLYHL